MIEFVSIPASMFWVMVGFIVFLVAFNAYLFHKWDMIIKELDSANEELEWMKDVRKF